MHDIRWGPKWNQRPRSSIRTYLTRRTTSQTGEVFLGNSLGCEKRTPGWLGSQTIQSITKVTLLGNFSAHDMHAYTHAHSCTLMHTSSKVPPWSFVDRLCKGSTIQEIEAFGISFFGSMILFTLCVWGLSLLSHHHHIQHPVSGPKKR